MVFVFFLQSQPAFGGNLVTSCHISQEVTASSLRWCSPGYVPVKERVCGPDIELFVVMMLPY